MGWLGLQGGGSERSFASTLQPSAEPVSQAVSPERALGGHRLPHFWGALWGNNPTEPLGLSGPSQLAPTQASRVVTVTPGPGCPDGLCGSSSPSGPTPAGRAAGKQRRGPGGRAGEEGGAGSIHQRDEITAQQPRWGMGAQHGCDWPITGGSGGRGGGGAARVSHTVVAIVSPRPRVWGE